MCVRMYVFCMWYVKDVRVCDSQVYVHVCALVCVCPFGVRQGPLEEVEVDENDLSQEVILY